MINIESVVESDIDRCGSYVALYYQFPFPEESVRKERLNEEMRFIMKKPIITITSDSNNCQKGE